ncbi:aldehyde dehydrogenase family protein [Actinocorallia sp. A-T 12471]|uniref:aldehyde dehydrogenase family protein n=1 Tax=Actinocorallia sp. A-T 12471 TaxID=3089813 RepID=UPI0029D4073C|nr:aldehyde dehydrogenase family protein [Actinocorallia sp. A-T 12471]MDX6740621.1 aldehyde dehydrogenase family protein [Actinocorallia sp. A-T 12471]
MNEPRMLINGELVAGSRALPVVNPATEEVFLHVAGADAAQVGAAVDAAADAFPAWAALPVHERRKALAAISERAMRHAEELAELLVKEQGKPLAIARIEVAMLAGFFRFYAEMEIPERVVAEADGQRVVTRRRPLGVVAAIVPWNMPVAMLGGKLPAALLVGNTVVVKPAGTTPAATLRFGELVRDLLPPGVLNIVADANDLGDVLTTHPRVRKVSFTGSTATGRRVMAAVADDLKRLTLELGGNDAGIVLDDVDVAAAAPGIFGGAFFNSGQICVALKRLYVHESVYEPMVEALAAIAREAVVGDGFADGVTVGPIQNRAQYERVLDYLAVARADGRVVAGGEPEPGPGWFVRPTVVADVTDGSRLVDEEQFGPILPVVKYRDLDEVIPRINRSDFGLGGSVWSADPRRAADVAARLECGTVWINQHGMLAPHVPFGGAKHSGVGTEFAAEGLEEMSQLQVINAVPVR